MHLTASEAPLSLNRPDGTRLAVYRREPNATPHVTLVLVHGWSASAAVWDDVIRRLPTDDRVRIITFDQRGHGASTQGRTPAGMGVLADDLEAVLRTFSRDAPAIVAAHSMGSMAALEYAARDARTTPVRIAGLLLASASNGQIDLRLAGHPPLTRAMGSARTAIAEACTRAPRSTRYLRDLLSPSASPRPATDVAAAWFRAILDFDVVGRLTALQETPVHLVTGALDRVIPPIHTCRLAAELAHARIHVAEGATHRIPSERPALLASLLMDLVERACAHQPTPSRDADGLLQTTAQLLFAKRSSLRRGRRLPQSEPAPDQRSGSPTRVRQEALIETRQ
ncbi:alpha/beta hydrolase (plasmid) [Streptomyces sp. NBC_00015]|uniref:alpha/beta fold hydrolase n=1 Tax=Streptomyces sp. NBC_00015 TaxID=2903611 RepID=UPI002F915632